MLTKLFIYSSIPNFSCVILPLQNVDRFVQLSSRAARIVFASASSQNILGIFCSSVPCTQITRSAASTRGRRRGSYAWVWHSGCIQDDVVDEAEDSPGEGESVRKNPVTTCIMYSIAAVGNSINSSFLKSGPCHGKQLTIIVQRTYMKNIRRWN